MLLIVAQLVMKCPYFYGIQSFIAVLMNPVHILTIYLFKIYFNIILPFMPRSGKVILPFRFYDLKC
jgi:hypothetical protein